MKRILLPIALAIATAMPLSAAAQQAPPQGPPGGGPPPMSDADRSQMRAHMDQMRKMHEQFRAQVLGTLSPAHRQLLASVVGSLAVAAQPDYRAAAQQLDAALSPAEKNAILGDEQQMRAQMKSMMAEMPKRPWPHPGGAGMKGKHRGGEHHKPTAGGILLGLAGGHPMMRGGWR